MRKQSDKVDSQNHALRRLRERATQKDLGNVPANMKLNTEKRMNNLRSFDASCNDRGSLKGRCLKGFAVRKPQLLLFCMAIHLLALGVPALAASLEDGFQSVVQPYVQKYCIECHTTEKPKGELDFTKFNNAGEVVESFRRWENIIDFIRKGEMPPKESAQPSIDESNAAVAAIHAILIAEARKHAGDPGAVFPRRLSNTEYDRSILALTGVDIRPTKDFPADPAGGEGFDNTGEALSMSPNLLKKYLSASQSVADHLVLKPNGMSFAPFPITSYNERTKLTEQAIIDFYESHQVDTLTYLEAAWRFQHRAVDDRALNIVKWAEKYKLSPRYLTLVWITLSESLTDPNVPNGFFKELGQAWLDLPAPSDNGSTPSELVHFHERIEFGRRLLTATEGQLIQANAGNWPINHLHFRAKTAELRDKFDPSSFKQEVLLNLGRINAASQDIKESLSIYIKIDNAVSNDDGYVIFKRPLFSKSDQWSTNAAEESKHEVQTLRSVLETNSPELFESLAFGKHPLGGTVDGDSFVVKAPATIEIPLSVELQRELRGKHLLVQCQLDTQIEHANSVFIQHSTQHHIENRFMAPTELLASRDRPLPPEIQDAATAFCKTFPNRFYYVDSGRGLSAGFHLVEGFFRDDRPLVDKVLSEQELAELNRLWEELDFVTESAETLLRGFVWFERAEREVLHDKRFDFLRSEDPHLVEDEMLDKFERLYLEKMGVRMVGETLTPENRDEKYRMIHGFFSQIRNGLSQQKAMLAKAEPLAFESVEEFARRAFRRSLTPQDKIALRTLYEKLRADGLGVELALRGVVMSVLMSPDYCYVYQSAPQGDATYAISNHEMASRLSLFLWASLPDDELLEAADMGALQSADALVVQAKRMLHDPRIEGFSREFFGQWLRFRDYLTKDPINAAAFPEYDAELREAMMEEPVKLATYLIQNDFPITQLLTSDVTFINRRLAKHYGGELEKEYLKQNQHWMDNHKPLVSSELAQRQWHMVTGLKGEGRGGLFGMAVILAKNSAGERTSPVKRGFWSVHHLLGQHFPPPPADVPELPKSESTATKTIRELLATHVSGSQCARCHQHFDSLGIAMEGFDAIGRWRIADSAGRKVDDRAELPNGENAQGIPGLIDYVESQRRDDFVRTLCRKFLGYALGRSVILSDQPLLDEMKTKLEENEYRFSVLFETVIRSSQFRTQRGRGFVSSGL